MATQVSPIHDLLSAVVKDGAPLAEAYVTANAGAIIAEAQALGVKAIDALIPFVVSALPKSGLIGLLEPQIAAAIQAEAPALIAALGGEEQALLALVKAELAKLAANGLG